LYIKQKLVYKMSGTGSIELILLCENIFMKAKQYDYQVIKWKNEKNTSTIWTIKKSK
jgi:hypothetical protein